MITLESLRSLKEQIDFIKIQLDETLKERSKERLFNNSDEYYRTLKNIQYFPQDYFQFRMFDFIVSLKYNNRIKCYYLYIEQLKEYAIDISNFYSFVKKHNLKTSPNDLKLYIPQEKIFDDAFKIFLEFVSEVCQYSLKYRGTLLK